MIGEAIPKAVVRRINNYRTQHNLPLLDEERKKKKEVKIATIDVSF